MSSHVSAQLLLKGIQPIEIFKGSDEQDPITWLQTIDELFDATKVDTNDRRRLLPMYFGDDVKKWYRSEDLSDDYDEFKKQFINAFTSSVYKLKISTKLMNRRQTSNESVQSYYFDILALCTRLNPDMKEDEKILYLLRGLKPSIQQQVIMGDPKLCKDLFEYAKRAEAATAIIQSSPIESTASNDLIDETTAALRRASLKSNYQQPDPSYWRSPTDQRGRNYQWTQNRYDNGYRNNQYEQSKRRNSSQIRCYNCHGIGHYASQCPSHLN